MAVKRRYESAHRQEQAKQTRGAILRAAAVLFVEPGYAATPLTAVAAEAGVAIQTVYKVFGSKQALLSALVDVMVAGDDEPVALPDRQFVADIQALSDARAKLERYARHLAETLARTAQVMLALAAAATADADAAAIWRKNVDDRRAGMGMFAAELASTGQLRPEHTAGTAADVLWLAMDVRNYDWLVRQRGWPAERFQRWYVDTVAAALLVPPASRTPANHD
ncbi:helix-turn-helix domain-containing protein [Dactylosporangium sp. NPDC049742]|uniref:TetR/AcrR family transcriptional regulator n=1 Tax=Dactylosporangium sp. NPDC049742 TaxID=3154737 RepID=UPI0034452DD8